MKELSAIIERLHTINQQIVDKDNLIDLLQPLITLISQLITDPELMKTDIYLDLRAKYILQIEEKLKRLNETPNTVTIEPENVIDTTKIKANKNRFTKEDVIAPIKTNIFEAPSCRHVFKKKKPEEKTTKTTSATGSTTGSTTTPNKECISFDYQGQQYLISLKENQGEYMIYDAQLSLAGQLKGPVLTLITNTDTMESQTIQLKTAQTSTDDKYLFGHYMGGTISIP